MDYPFTVIELHINNAGEGDGTMSWATKVIPDKENNIVVLENCGTQHPLDSCEARANEQLSGPVRLTIKAIMSMLLAGVAPSWRSIVVICPRW